MNVVCPIQWPIDHVALVCSYCGSVIEYLGNLIQFTFKSSRWKVTNHVAHELLPLEWETAREMVLVGIDRWMTDEQIAKYVGIPLAEVARIAKAEGF